jgi:hypothetical protein
MVRISKYKYPMDNKTLIEKSIKERKYRSFGPHKISIKK